MGAEVHGGLSDRGCLPLPVSAARSTLTSTSHYRQDAWIQLPRERASGRRSMYNAGEKFGELAQARATLDSVHVFRMDLFWVQAPRRCASSLSEAGKWRVGTFEQPCSTAGRSPIEPLNYALVAYLCATDLTGNAAAAGVLDRLYGARDGFRKSGVSRQGAHAKSASVLRQAGNPYQQDPTCLHYSASSPTA